MDKKRKRKNYFLKKQRVFVGMSGGVDSSVSVALLKDRGFDVTGVFIKTWSPDWLPCTWREERRDAMRVTAKLKIPLITLDLEKEYKERVVDYMITEYRSGRVPNPDVMCNKVIKFGGFFDYAMNHGADFVATGHYARVVRASPQTNNSLPSPAGDNYLHSRPIGPFGDQARAVCESLSSKNPNSSWLCTSVDREKDQTYFLWTLTQRELSRTLFPIGHLQKSDVRKLARKFDLPNAEKKDSQGLCFMGKIDVKEFLKHYIKEKTGRVLNEDGEVIGVHEGAAFYTLGERHGFNIINKSTNDLPHYVIHKDIKKNILVVSQKRDEGEILKKEVMVKNVNWNQGLEPNLKKKFKARIRYRQELQDCMIGGIKGGQYKIIFDKGQVAPAPGQSVVIYEDGVCLGGGIIV
ncbi:MAG: tRNA-specific 2-thiouridylase [Candidatus Vogelbacteria bacterium]|nr:tRNA-specific 2-thiouridylase [Candidatus Vogelbacteria bacterium]